MKKRYLFVISLLSALLILSCSLGLDPAKSGSTEVSFSVGEATAGRIIAPGTGYLYIRTVGGPTGENGPFYGPYQLSAGSIFTTTDIPAGSYDGFGILYATEPLGSLYDERLYSVYEDKTFTELMSLPDDEFMEFGFLEGLLGEYPDNTAFDILINGRATAEMLENVRIIAGQRNIIAAKLMPVIGLDNSFDFPSSPENVHVYGEEPTRSRRYIELINAPTVGTYNTLSFHYTVSGETTYSMGSIIVYNALGIPIGAQVVNSSEILSGIITVPYTAQSTYYVFVDFTGYEMFITYDLL